MAYWPGWLEPNETAARQTLGMVVYEPCDGYDQAGGTALGNLVWCADVAHDAREHERTAEELWVLGTGE